ncbi:MAG: PIN domain-containing protein, partial [Pseudomonadota bacterium]
MLRHLLDTNLCIRVLRDRPRELNERFNLEAEGLCISTIVLTELLHGAAKSSRPEHNRGEVERFAAR